MAIHFYLVRLPYYILCGLKAAVLAFCYSTLVTHIQLSPGNRCCKLYCRLPSTAHNTRTQCSYFKLTILRSLDYTRQTALLLHYFSPRYMYSICVCNLYKFRRSPARNTCGVNEICISTCFRRRCIVCEINCHDYALVILR